MIRCLQAALAVTVAFAVWLVGFSPGSDEPAVLPDTSEQFSLDLEVVATAEAPLVYAVEQRARPDYRILRLDPTTGDVETIFTVPEDAIIYGIDVDATGSVLAIAYSPDLSLDGSGLWTFDMATDDLTQVAPVVPGTYLTDPGWGENGDEILATRVDRSADDEQLDAVGIDIETGAVEVIATDAVAPTDDGGLVHYLGVEPDTAARQSVHTLDRTTGTDTVVASGEVDLDHLVTVADALVVAVLDSDDTTGGLTLGTPAAAHGSHDIPSTWWTISADALSGPASEDPESSLVYDADAAAETIVSATREGLTIGGETPIRLIASRALRFVTIADS
ncbi:MAG: hypothetical protein OSA99_09665 [Acidimicrobiales bacterium]|nr:hypothetical protein [Acidimicrobiales bacterium]